MHDVFINSRFLGQPQSGVQRYAHGIVNELEFLSTKLHLPPRFTVSSTLHEQLLLPQHLKRNGTPLLLNFCNTAPTRYPRQIVTLHDMAVFENPRWFKPAFRNWYRWLLPRIAADALHIVTVSAFSKIEIMRHLGIPSERITIAQSAPDPNFLGLTPEKPSGIPDEPFLLMVGSHDPRKNIPSTALALDPWLRANGWNLVITGHFSATFSSQKFNITPNTIYRTNITDKQLNWLYRHAKATIHPSFYEGFSLVPAESLMLGTPAAVSDIPPHRELLADRAAYFVPGDRQGLITALEHTLDRKERTLPLDMNFRPGATKWLSLIQRFSTST